MIPVADPAAGVRALRPQLDAAIARVLDGGRYILGSECEAFEREWAAFLGGEDVHAVGVASGTDAVELALRALGVGQGDAVITVAHTANGTVSAIERAGAVPVFADIDPRTFTLSADSAARCLAAHGATLRFKALLPVHLYGQPADLAALGELARAHGLALVEDAAQAHGARWRGQAVGTLGAAGAFSFYPTKNLAALGDGGAVVTRDAALAERLRGLRQYGWTRRRYVSDERGVNSRLDELQAAILRVKLAHLDAGNRRRAEIAARYTAAFAGGELVVPPVAADTTTHAWHQYTLRAPRRDALRAFLEENGVGTNVLYPEPVHRQPAYAATALVDPAGLPATESAAREILGLPIYPELSDDAVAAVIRAVQAWR